MNLSQHLPAFGGNDMENPLSKQLGSWVGIILY